MQRNKKINFTLVASTSKQENNFEEKMPNTDVLQNVKTILIITNFGLLLAHVNLIVLMSMTFFNDTILRLVSNEFF